MAESFSGYFTSPVIKRINLADVHTKQIFAKLLIHEITILRQSDLPDFQRNEAAHAHTKLNAAITPDF